MCSFTKKIFFYLCVIKLRLKFTVINEVHKVFVLHKSIKKKIHKQQLEALQSTRANMKFIKISRPPTRFQQQLKSFPCFVLKTTS